MIALVPSLGATVTKADFVPETVFQSMLDTIEGSDNVDVIAPGSKQLNDMALNRQRCAILGTLLFEWRRQ